MIDLDNNYSVEKIHKLYNDKTGHCLGIREDAEVTGMISLFRDEDGSGKFVYRIGMTYREAVMFSQLLADWLRDNKHLDEQG